MRASYARGVQPRQRFEYLDLPEAQKRDLCERLLAEHGLDVRGVNGDWLVVACPISGYHQDQDRNPTGGLSYEYLSYNCLGCGASGGLLWFIATLRDCTIDEARGWLEGETGGGGTVMELAVLMRYFDALYEPKRRPAPIPTYSERLLDPWDEVHPYLTETWRPCRGVALEDARRFRCGYAPEYVVARWPDGTPRKTSERIILPHFWQGSLVGWQSRRLYDDGTPKFLSSVDFPKDQTIFNYDRRADTTVLVESMLSAVKHDRVAHTEATFGASVTDRQRQLLTKHRRVVLWMDNDDAGWAAVRGLWRVRRGEREMITEGLGSYLSRYVDVYVVDSPYAADPADMVAEDVARLVDAAVPYSVWRPPRQLLCYLCGNVNERGHPCVT